VGIGQTNFDPSRADGAGNGNKVVHQSRSIASSSFSLGYAIGVNE